MCLLSLKATSVEECDVISSLAQDSIFHFQYHFFDEQSCGFHLMLNRFCWEHDKDGNDCYYRVHSGLYIHNVTAVRVNQAFKNNRHKYLSLLTVHTSPHEINLLFADNKHVCVEVSEILVYLKDLHDKYPTMVKPSHDAA